MNVWNVWGGHSLTTTSGCHRTTAPVRLPHTSYRWRGERVIEPIKRMGIIRRPWLKRASGGNLARTPVLHPTLYEKCHGILNDYRESGPRFSVSSERRIVYCDQESKVYHQCMFIRMCTKFQIPNPNPTLYWHVYTCIYANVDASCKEFGIHFLKYAL